MHIKRYDFDFSRRVFLEKTARGLGSAGVLTALWPEISASADITKAYPEELLDIETFTRGNIKVGDVIDADNVDLIQDLLDPIVYQEVKQDQRTFFIQPGVTDVETMYPPYFFDATLKNQGQARFDEVGNVYTKDGQPWIGGLPFPNVQSGNEAIANITLSWGRHDKAMYPIPCVVSNQAGEKSYEYDFVWGEQQCTGLVHPDAGGPYLKGHEDKTRLQVVWFTHTFDVKGSAFLSHWHYDQREIPELWGYLPNFKRVRRFPANQRFEPYMPGMNINLSDAWGAGDPMLTWGNWKVIHRGPFLGSTHAQWRPDRENWAPPLVGGAKGQTYWYAGKALIPEVIVFEGEPVGFPRAPISKRRLFVDARNMGVVQAISFDRDGLPWKGFEGAGGQRQHEGTEMRTTDGRLEWSWCWGISHDMKTGSVSRLLHGKECRGNWISELDGDQDMLNNYMTPQALRRLGT